MAVHSEEVVHTHPTTIEMTPEQILNRIEELSAFLTDPRIVTKEEMDRLYPVYGSEGAIMRHKKRDNDTINSEIEELTQRLSP